MISSQFNRTLFRISRDIASPPLTFVSIRRSSIERSLIVGYPVRHLPFLPHRHRNTAKQRETIFNRPLRSFEFAKCTLYLSGGGEKKKTRDREEEKTVEKSFSSVSRSLLRILLEVAVKNRKFPPPGNDCLGNSIDSIGIFRQESQVELRKPSTLSVCTPDCCTAGESFARVRRRQGHTCPTQWTPSRQKL